jgi:hypothetical protein
MSFQVASFPRLILKFENFLVPIYLADRTYVKDGASGTYGGQAMCIQGFGVENWRKKTTLGTQT